MKVLLVGAGGVGEAIATIVKPREWLEQMVLADYNVKRAREVQKKLGWRFFQRQSVGSENQGTSLLQSRQRHIHLRSGYRGQFCQTLLSVRDEDRVSGGGE